jgi:cobyrinic acid a,c-diamide synthase
VAVARDEAFAFIYAANVQTLQTLGATLSFFSPLHDAALPSADALYLPGGYPELHHAKLAANHAMREAVAAHHAQGKPIVAECGGMLALLDGLTDHDGQRAPMWGLLPGEAQMQKRLVNLGMHSLHTEQGELRGHTYHHACMESPAVAAGHTSAQRFNGQAEAVYRVGRLHASFFHMYFPSNPAAVAALFAPLP